MAGQTVTSFHGLGLCRHADPEAFFPVTYSADRVAEARAVCRHCPVATACLQEALAAEAGKPEKERHGIRAGWTPGERFRGYQGKPRRHGLAA
jgi:WhiB family redox-sensing transcriptional regulator